MTTGNKKDPLRMRVHPQGVHGFHDEDTGSISLGIHRTCSPTHRLTRR